MPFAGARTARREGGGKRGTGIYNRSGQGALPCANEYANEKPRREHHIIRLRGHTHNLFITLSILLICEPLHSTVEITFQLLHFPSAVNFKFFFCFCNCLLM